MSFLQQVVQDGRDRFILAPVGDMRCSVTAFLTPDLFQQTDESLWRQAAQAACFPGAKGLYLMPDCHLGFSIPVGGVLVTEDTIVQGGSGYDISCGVVYLQVPGIGAADVADWNQRQRWASEVSRRVALGIGTHHPPLMKRATYPDMSDIFRYGAKALGVKGGGLRAAVHPGR